MLIFVLGVVLGFIIASILSGKKEEAQGKLKSWKFNLRNYKIHLHHWLIFSLILVVLILIRFYNGFVYGFLVGLIIQGITYKDFYKIVTRIN